MPAGNGWEEGLREGDSVLKVIDGDVNNPRSLLILGSNGEEQLIEAKSGTLAEGADRWALPLIGLVFALLGNLVLWRRSDLAAARAFWLTSIVTALSLVMVPASAGPAPLWALAIGFPLVWFSPWTLFAFYSNLTMRPPSALSKIKRWSLWAGIALTASYAIVASVEPNAYTPVQAALSLIFITLIGFSIVALVTGYIGTSLESERPVVVVMGISTLLAVLPLLLLVFIPIISGVDEIVPAHVAALAVVAIPLGFTYSVLQHQMLGIRRLVQRGGVYFVLSSVLLIIMVLLVGVATALDPDLFQSTRNDVLIVGGAVVLGALAFSYFRPILQRLADTYVYRDIYDYREAIVGLSKEAQLASRSQDVVVTMLEQVRATAGLEGYLLATGRTQTAPERVSGGVSAAKLAQALATPGFLPESGLAIRQIQGEPILTLVLDEDTALLLGPKADGEAFRDDDVKLMEPVGTLVGMLLARSKLNEELRELNGRLMTAQEEERARLAIDLHDGPLQQAVFLSRTAVPSKKVIDVGKSLVIELRAITNALRPPMLDDLGLRYAIDWLARNTEEKHGLSITLDLEQFPDETRLPPASEMAIYRCAQEALNNVVKHAQATTASISLTITGGKAVLVVQDNGIGFGATERERAARGGHLGLVGMRERVRHAGGTLSIASKPNQGSTLTISVPVDATQPEPPATSVQ
jgi:signal transduction histidine kinase